MKADVTKFDSPLPKEQEDILNTLKMEMKFTKIIWKPLSTYSCLLIVSWNLSSHLLMIKEESPFPNQCQVSLTRFKGGWCDYFIEKIIIFIIRNRKNWNQ